MLAGLLLVYTLLHAGGMLLFGDNAMRMVTAGDLLAGQPWQDLTQHRDNTPYGTSMHWSRLVDAPLALLVTLTTPFVGVSAALHFAAIAWPALLLLPLLVLNVALIRRLVPGAGTPTSLALVAVSIVLLSEFLPGRVDHHNVQMVLSLLIAFALVAWRTTWRGAAVAGIATATSLAIGMETLPVAAVTVAIYSLLWLAQPQRFRLPLIVFGAILALATLLHFLAATAPASYLDRACDMLSIVYVVMGVVGGGALLVVALLASGLDARLRAGVLATAGGLTFAVAALLFPDCLAGPYAMVDLLAIPSYFEVIPEAKSLLQTLLDKPGTALFYATAVLVAVPLAAWRVFATSGEQRIDWIVLCAFLFVTTAVMFLQLRGVRFAALFALPAGAWLIAEARARYVWHSTLTRAALLIGSWLLVSSAAHHGAFRITHMLLPQASFAAVPLESAEQQHSCTRQEVFRRLAELPAGRAIVPYNLAPNILLYTAHEVVSAGFHRNLAGTSDTIAFFGGEAAARVVAENRSLDYVVICEGVAEYTGRIGPAPDQHWTWLEPLSAPDARLSIFRVRL